MIRWILVAALFAIVAAEAQTPSHTQQPKSSGPSNEVGAARRVTDNAGVLSAQEIARLDQMLADYERETTHQIAILTVASLSGEAIEVFSRLVANAWGLGRKGFDNGILIVVAPTERKVRIELGRGFEPYLSDAQATEIIRVHFAPAFRQKDYYLGLISGLQQLMIEGRTLVTPGLPTDTRARPIAKPQS